MTNERIDQQYATRLNEAAVPCEWCNEVGWAPGSRSGHVQIALCSYCGESRREVTREDLESVQSDLVAAMKVVSAANVLNQHDHLLTSLAKSFATMERLIKRSPETPQAPFSHEFDNGVKCYDESPIVWANGWDCLHEGEGGERSREDYEESFRLDPPGAVAEVGTPKRDYVAELKALEQEPLA